MISAILAFITIIIAPVAWAVGCRKKRPVLAFIAACLAGSVFFIGVSHCQGVELQREMNKFDLNGDGAFSGSELTNEAKIAIGRWSADTGRAFAPIVAPIVITVWTTIVFALSWIVNKIYILLSKHKGKSA